MYQHAERDNMALKGHIVNMYEALDIRICARPLSAN